MSKPSKSVLGQFKPKDGYVDVTIDGGTVYMPLPVALWLKRVFEMDETFESQKELFEQQRKLWEWMMSHPIPIPVPRT